VTFFHLAVFLNFSCSGSHILSLSSLISFLERSFTLTSVSYMIKLALNLVKCFANLLESFSIYLIVFTSLIDLIEAVDLKSLSIDTDGAPIFGTYTSSLTGLGGNLHSSSNLVILSIKGAV